MTTAVDTNILLDHFGAVPAFGRRSTEALRSRLREGQLVACEVVWSDTASMFPSSMAAQEAVERMTVEFSAISQASALAAAAAWKAYRLKGGRRERVAADFLIGAHAQLQAERLLTRDRGFCRAYFKGLSVLDPAKP